MVDAFPSPDSDPDHSIQLRIDADLRNSLRLQQAFEAAYPVDPTAKATTLIERMRHRPTPEMLYPLLSAAPGRRDWLMPLLRRFAWHQAHAEASAPWPEMLRVMLQLALQKLRELSESEFLALAQPARELLSLGCFNYLQSMAAFARALERTAPLSRPVVDSLAALLELCGHPKSSVRDRTVFVWPLFRSETGLAHFDACWSARVRRDLAGMPPKPRAVWLKLFDTQPHYAEGGAGIPSRSCLAAVKKVGNDQLAPALRRWIDMLADTPLSPVDVVVLKHVIVLCDLVGGAACDELLYRIACAPWTERAPNWLIPYLWVLRRRPQDRAFACLEALTMNPATNTPDVRRQYEALLAVFGAASLPASPVGVDGFPLDRDPALQLQHARLDQLLRLAASAAAQGPYVHPAIAARREAMRAFPEKFQTPAAKAWQAQFDRPLPFFQVAPEATAAFEAMKSDILREFSATPADLHRAVVARVDWIAAREQQFSSGELQLWRQLLRGLGCGGGGLLWSSLANVDALPLDSLLQAIRAGAGSSKVMQLCQQYVAANGWHADLVEAMRQWVPTLGTPSNLTERARAEWFLWFENVAPIQLDSCWSHRIRRDLRDMPVADQPAWRALLDNPAFQITGKPPKKWLKAGEAAFRKIDPAGFRRRFTAWFEPFAKSEPLRLTITGRNILRVLMWYVLIAEDPAVDEALTGFAAVKWKTRDAAARAAQAEMAFSFVLSERAPEKALPILENLVASGQAFAGSATHRVYEQLCAKKNRRPVPAIPVKSGPVKDPAIHQLFDNLTVGDFERITKLKIR